MGIREEIANQIIKARQEMAMSQSELAALTGVERTTISKVENGRFNATIELIAKIGSALNLKLVLVNDTTK